MDGEGCEGAPGSRQPQRVFNIRSYSPICLVTDNSVIAFDAFRRAAFTAANTDPRRKRETPMPSWPQLLLLLIGSFIGEMYVTLIPSVFQCDTTVAR